MPNAPDIDPDGTFRADVAASLAADPMPSLERLAANVGLPVEHVVHYALYRWTAAGAEALMSTAPDVLERLDDAAARGDLGAVRGIVAFLRAGTTGDWR